MAPEVTTGLQCAKERLLDAAVDTCHDGTAGNHLHDYPASFAGRVSLDGDVPAPPAHAVMHAKVSAHALPLSRSVIVNVMI
jgi:hypothetical protein